MALTKATGSATPRPPLTIGGGGFGSASTSWPSACATRRASVTTTRTSGAQRYWTLTAIGSTRVITAGSGVPLRPSSITITTGPRTATANGAGVRLTGGRGSATSPGAGLLITMDAGSITTTTGAGPRVVRAISPGATGGDRPSSPSSTSTPPPTSRSHGIR